MESHKDKRPVTHELGGGELQGAKDDSSENHGSKSNHYCPSRQERLESVLAWMDQLYEALNRASFVSVEKREMTTAIMGFMQAWERLADACTDDCDGAILEHLKEAAKHAAIIHRGEIQIAGGELWRTH